MIFLLLLVYNIFSVFVNVRFPVSFCLCYIKRESSKILETIQIINGISTAGFVAAGVRADAVGFVAEETQGKSLNK